uniref:C2H2-type domain-containing protein n=1 Tax=Anopheles stephensi TaxID=30069 RepID=A0A182Y9L6_ANOST
MLEKLFPAVFNPEQVERDRKMQWPSTICPDCRSNVLSAYALYERCEKSSSSSTVINCKGERDIPLRESIDVSEEVQADANELETKIDLYQCVLCNAPTYSSPKAFTEHLKENHPDQIRTCEHCPKVFVTQTAFEQHLYCHATGRSFFCTFCDKGFQTEQLLKNHIRTHTHRSNYLCFHCGKEFNNNSNLRQHIIGHSGHKPWACNLCPCRFSTKGGLTTHQNTHTKEKAFSCDTCGSQFNKHYSLIKHKLIHTGERPFGCEVCGMRYDALRFQGLKVENC